MECGGTITGYWGDPCFGNTEEVVFDTCFYDIQLTSFRYDGGVEGTCAEPEAVVEGGVEAIEPFTLCCAADPL